MQLENVTHDELQQVLAHIQQALYHHEQWYKALMRTLVCRLQSDEHDILPEAYKHCRFGQWYYNHAPKSISAHPGFVAIGNAHQEMHQLTTHLLIAVSSCNPSLCPFEYDNFANALDRFRLEVFSLKNEIELLLYNRDPLTMAISRVNMLTVLREQQAAAIRQSLPCCIALLDIDYFKKINDTYGHAVGDKVLASLAHYMLDHIRPYDKLFRYGGEEFLLSLPQTDLLEAYEMLNRLRDEIAKMPIDLGVQKPIFTTFSVGLTLLEIRISLSKKVFLAQIKQCMTQKRKAAIAYICGIKISCNRFIIEIPKP